MTRTALLLYLLFFSINGWSQKQFDTRYADGIRQIPDDTAKVNRLNDYIATIQAASPLQAISLIEESAAISRKLSYAYGLATTHFLRSGLYFYEMKTDSSRILLEQAFSILAGRTDAASLALNSALLLRKASLFQQEQSNDSAIFYYLQAADAYSDIGQTEKSIVAFYNISGIYNYAKDTLRALQYAHQTRRLAIAANDSTYLLRSLIVLGEAFVLNRKFDSVLWVTQTGIPSAQQLRMPFAIGKFNVLLGQYYSETTHRYDSAVYHYQIALDTFTKYNIAFDRVLTLQHLGNTYLKMDDPSNAIRYATEASTLARKMDLNQLLFYTLRNLSTAYEKAGNIGEAYHHLNEFLAVNEVLQQRNDQKTVMELEAKYQAQKKEAQMAIQEKDIQEKKFLISLLMIGLIALTTISVLVYRNNQNRQKIQRQRIHELETQKQLMSTEAVLKGEEQERTRLAKDLHDGLGGMLSGIKYSFQTMKGNLIMTPENHLAFERSMDMLDNSIKEMRRVAHNMMPEALVKFGLNTALRDFCQDISQSGALAVHYQSIGMENTSLDQTTAITIYRIVQELINNTIKHASASRAFVQVSKSNNTIHATVEDNGTGFDTKIINREAGGIGWKNIQSRLSYLKGKADISSEKGKGTSVVIEIQVP